MNRERTKAYLLSLGVKGLTIDRFDKDSWNLSNLNFNGLNLSKCYLRGSNFSGTTLVETDLSRANCAECDFTDAVLWGAIVYKTSFHNATCPRADFSGIEINRTIFDFADIGDAIFNNVRLGRVGVRVNLVKARIYDPPHVFTPAQVFYHKVDRLVRRGLSRIRLFYLQTLKFLHRDIK